MLSRADTRRRIESVLRIASVALLALMLWRSLERGRPESFLRARSASLSSALRNWSRAPMRPDHIAVQLDGAPSSLQRDWLAALHASGSDVRWSGELPATAITSAAVPSPRGGLTVLVAAPRGAAVSLSDEIGALDTTTAGAGGARFAVPLASGEVRATVGNTLARAHIPDSAQLKRLLVLASAGWEAKFTVAALEEDGWKVDLEMRVAPGVAVTQGTRGQIDTARYTAVIALDESAAAHAGEITRYVSAGGGLILAGTAAKAGAFSGLRAGITGQIQGDAVLTEPEMTLRLLPVVPVVGLRNDAVALERRGGVISAAARRHEAGRVLQLGYAETWRWRMNGGDASLAEHRAWWSSKAASVAYVPLTAAARGDTTDNAPLARLVASLGQASRASSLTVPVTAASVSSWWLFAMLSFCLLAEWASRRLRGAR